MGGISRHEAMRPLSRHHHHALMAALNIRKGLEGYDGDAQQGNWPERIDALRKEVLAFWEQDGNAHFREEEEILMPVYSRYASVRHEELQEMWYEHVEIRALIAAIAERDGDLAELLSELAEKLQQHVRREERVIFPMMEQVLPEEVLRKMAPYFHEFH